MIDDWSRSRMKLSSLINDKKSKKSSDSIIFLITKTVLIIEYKHGESLHIQTVMAPYQLIP